MHKLWTRRKAISTMIGGVIVLSLFLTALVSAIFVSQQYDQYQTQASRMSQYDAQRSSEYLVANPPGLTLLTASNALGWGNGCTTTYNCYNMTVSNLGGVGVQIVRIYINSTGSGCTTLCVLNPSLTIAPYSFNQANQFVNRGETNHVVTLALPIAVTLPNPTQPALPMNTVSIASSMGNLFPFQWPFQVSVFGQTQSAYSQGIMKVAYQCTSYSGGQCSSGGFDSAKEPGVGGSGTAAQGYCHNETPKPYPAPPGYAEQLTGISGLLSGTTLWFVNPWITAGNNQPSYFVLDSINNPPTGGGVWNPTNPETTIYFYVVIVNTGNTAYTPSAGTMDLTWYASDHIDSSLFGIYYNGQFYSGSTSPSINSVSIPAGAFYYAIFKVDNSIFMLLNPPTHSIMFWGGGSITNVGTSGTSAEDQSFYSGTILSSGLWIRYETSTGSCA